ncbi:MAG: DEAD/DEAH box helicase family protein [Candidatus Nanohaloarchaea archaeon]|nr:DEAD/DEAH box helicase family protein [Candidatus Nanohaloarchaea archaeon]
MSAAVRGVEHRDYQIEAAAELLENPRQDYVVNMPVGGGKTETALELIGARSNLDPDYSSLIIVPNRRVEDQWYDRFRDYDVDEFLDIARNQPKSQQTGMVGTHFKGSDPGGSELHERRQRIQNWEQEQLQSSKTQDFTESDVVLTTYQLLDSDIQNGRIDGGLIADYDDVIIDEVTHFVAVAEEQHPDAEVPLNFRPNKYFDRFYDALTGEDGTRVIGLTGLYGDRLDAIEGELGTEIIRPSKERVDHHRPTLERQDPNLAQDPQAIYILGGLDNAYRETRYTVKSMLEGEGVEDPSVDLYSLQTHAGRDDEIGILATKALKQRTLRSRIQEGTYNSLKPFEDEIVEALRFGISEEEIEQEFEEGRSVADDPERGRQKLEALEAGEYELPLFPTLKEVGVRNLQNQMLDAGHQALYFVRHVDTAQDLPNILPGSTGVITGGTSRQQQVDILDEFIGGGLDALAMTYDVGGEGLDFSNAEHVVLMGEPRTVQEHQNAVGRIRRGEGPKYEHALIYHDHQYEWRYEQYMDLLDEEAEMETESPSPSPQAVAAIEDVIAA